MTRKEGSEKLSEAVELLNLLESLAEGFVSGNMQKNSVPWGGVQLALHDVKKRLIDVRVFLECEPSVDVESEGGKVKGIKQNQESSSQQVFSSLASRIQRAPTSLGRVRELSTSALSGQTKAEGEGGPFYVQGTASEHVIEDFDGEISF